MLNPNTRDSLGNTLLHRFLKTEELNLVTIQALLEENIDVNEKNIFGETALLLLVARKEASKLLTLVKRFCDKGAALTIKNREGNTALHIAVQMEHMNIVQLLTARNRSLLFMLNNKRETPLALARAPIHAWLVRQGAAYDVDSVAGKACLEALVTQKDASLLTRLQCDNNHLATQNYLNNYFCRAVRLGCNVEILTWFIKSGAEVSVREVSVDVNTKELKKKSLLFIATENKDVEAVRFLLKNNADFNEILQNGDSLLHLAAKVNAPAIIALYLESQIDLVNYNAEGKLAWEYITDSVLQASVKEKTIIAKHAPLCLPVSVQKELDEFDVTWDPAKKLIMFQFAVTWGRKALVKWLLTHDNILAIEAKLAGINSVYLSREYPRIAEFLLKYGFDVNMLSNTTVLHSAVQSKKINLQFIELLLCYGADPNIEDCCGRTPFDYLIHKSSDVSEIIELFLAFGADPSLLHKPAQFRFSTLTFSLNIDLADMLEELYYLRLQIKFSNCVSIEQQKVIDRLFKKPLSSQERQCLLAELTLPVDMKIAKTSGYRPGWENQTSNKQGLVKKYFEKIPAIDKWPFIHKRYVALCSQNASPESAIVQKMQTLRVMK